MPIPGDDDLGPTPEGDAGEVVVVRVPGDSPDETSFGSSGATSAAPSWMLSTWPMASASVR